MSAAFVTTMVMTRLPDVTVPGQEKIQRIVCYKTIMCCFFTWVFLQIYIKMTQHVDFVINTKLVFFKKCLIVYHLKKYWTNQAPPL